MRFLSPARPRNKDPPQPFELLRESSVIQRRTCSIQPRGRSMVVAAALVAVSAHLGQNAFGIVTVRE